MTEVIRLTNGDLEIEVWTLGARLNGVWFQGIGSLVDGAATEEEARGAKEYHGAVVGPVANRIEGGKAEIDGRSCAFEQNERGRTTLHSGSTGFHAQEWTVAEQSESALKLTLDVPDGLGGFPGNKNVSASYTLGNGEMIVEFRATTDAPTWVNLALHPFWRAARDGRAGSLISVDADSCLPVDSFQIPTGEQASVAGTEFDLRHIGAPSSAIDHNYCLNAGASPAMRLEGDLGVRMDIETDAPGLQIFTGRDYGIAIEPQHWPDSMHHADFPSIRLDPGEDYTQSSTYRFSRL